MKFRAHDTFFIRKGWLSKGMKAVHSKPDVFVAKDENPMDVLGIGSNMVKSLRYWLVATNLTEEALLNKRRVQKFTGFGNQIFKNDRYMEEYGTLYLLHYMLSKNEEDATAWYFFFNEFNMSEFTREDFVAALQNYVSMKGETVAILRMKFVIPRLTLYNPHFVTYITSNADFLHGSRGFFHTKVMPVAGRRKAQMPR